MFEVQTKTETGETQSHRLDVLPDRCPRCHFAISPITLGTVQLLVNRRLVQLPLRCPQKECSELFLATYVRDPTTQGFSLRGTAPYAPIKPPHAEQVASVSPAFVEIYRQAAHTESLNLSEVAGMGYRKALEFLIKDFAIDQNPNDVESIKKMPLAKCITQYIKDANVQLVATRATWLGNDETHYVRRWETKDITDLKKLIKLTENAIENVLLAAHYAKEMPPT